MSRSLKLAALAALIATPAFAGQFNLGREATPNEIAAWDIDIRPDGAGLPEGSGDVFTGEEVFTEKCAICHGDFGEGAGRWPVLAGGQGTLNRARPVKTIGSYWPYLSTVWDYVHRAMPFGDAQSLTDDEVYAITAYILYLNDIVEDDFELSHENFAEVRLPNEENFFDDPRPDYPLIADGAPCMENCKTDVKITMHAAVLDVTPEDAEPAGGLEGEAAAAEPAAAESAEPAATEQAAVEPATEPAAEAAAVDPELIAAGEKVYKKCKACHQVGDGAEHRVGPELNSVIGRAAGGAEGFKYSPAMQEKGGEGLVWTAETLDAFLEKPKDLVPKTKMSFAGLRKADDRAAVIAYLMQFSE
jgi:cytochrome c